MAIKHKLIKIVIIFCIFILLPKMLFAQRRFKGGRRTYDSIGFTDITNHSNSSVVEDGLSKQLRKYDISIDLGLGNLIFEEFRESGEPVAQSSYTGDLYNAKGSLSVKETEGRWAIDFGAEFFGTSDRAERWWTGQKLFRVNRLVIKGLCMETTINYSFEEMSLSPFPVLAQPYIGCGLVYRFFGVRRQDITSFINNDTPIPKETDFALFGFEPGIGIDFTMDDGSIVGYVSIGIGMYGVSVENNFANKSTSMSPINTNGESILANIGLHGIKGKFFYHIGYSISRFNVTAKNSIPKSVMDLNRIVGNIGVYF